ncbi:MAG: outer rane assembly lipoprotein YfgL [Betaproteobacteria bacterium]|nr:outer rane assembly lipoprotein YfgL [Betaproteobacteria bacterium]
MTQAVTRLAALGASLLIIGGCAAPGDMFDKWFGAGPVQKPNELVVFKPTATAKIVWQASVGSSQRYVFSPAISDGSVYAADASGQIVRLDATNGKVMTRLNSKVPLSGGVGTDGNLVLVGSAKGEVIALDKTGKELWKVQLTSEILSAPQLSQNIVVIRTGDGRIFGLDATTGARKWLYQRALPPLTVRTAVGVLIYRGGVFAGFPGGRLLALSADTGNVGWEATVALPKGSTELERVADVSSLPITDGRQVCAVAFQGRAACFDLVKGAPIWGRDVSSISGMTNDRENIYIADDKSALLAFGASAGASLWKQDKLYGRYVSGPVVIGKYVAVGDFQGYVHFMSREDGSFVARIATDGSPIVAQPQVLNDSILVQTVKGGVYSIAIQ